VFIKDVNCEFSLLWITKTKGPFIHNLKYLKPISIHKDKYLSTLVQSSNLSKFQHFLGLNLAKVG
jgi:hypothetical protein